jgi:hypothetical protein
MGVVEGLQIQVVYVDLKHAVARQDANIVGFAALHIIRRRTAKANDVLGGDLLAILYVYDLTFAIGIKEDGAPLGLILGEIKASTGVFREFIFREC